MHHLWEILDMDERYTFLLAQRRCVVVVVECSCGRQRLYSHPINSQISSALSSLPPRHWSQLEEEVESCSTVEEVNDLGRAVVLTLQAETAEKARREGRGG